MAPKDHIERKRDGEESVDATQKDFGSEANDHWSWEAELDAEIRDLEKALCLLELLDACTARWETRQAGDAKPG